MKKISTLLVLSTLLTITVFAKYDDPQLSISSFTTAGNVQVEVDGRRYYFDNDKSIIIRNLRPGYHTIKVSKEKKRSNSNRIFNLGNRREVVYNSSVNLRSGYDYDIMINKFGKVFTDEARIDPNDWNNTDRDRDWDRNNDRTDQNDRDRDGDRTDRDRNGNYGNGYGREMSSADFNRAKQTLRNEMFENTRVDLAKQIINSNYFISQQVKELLQLFTFENNKLDLAKYAYGYTVDKNNYYLINDQLTFSNSKDELARYIRTYREQ
jgi:Domain of unknown function (DUF4476)